MAGLKRSPHDADITGAVKGIVTPTVRYLDQVLLDALSAQLRGVDELVGTELLRPLLLGIIDVNDDDLACALLDRALDDA